MAHLVSLATNARSLLAARTLVGRSSYCLLQLDHPSASREHALLYWERHRWWLRDLSRNGTTCNGQPLAREGERALRAGDRLVFGLPEAGAWELADGGPPRAFALNLRSGEQVEAFEERLLLPGPDDSEVSLSWSPGGIWLLRQGDREAAVRDGDVVQLADPWQVQLPQEGLPTENCRLAALSEVRLRLRLSGDAAHVTLQVEAPERTIDLGDRQPWFVLWALAEARQRDAAAPAHDQGWVDLDRLARRTGIEKKNLDTYIFRARRDLVAVGVEHAAQVIEARPRQRRLGVGLDQVILER